MTSESPEIVANMERAEESILAAQELAESGYFDFVASRTYYAVFYAATALLLSTGREFSKHSGVIANVHRHFVKTGRLTQEQGKNLNWLFELRNVGDYGVTLHVSAEEAQRAILAARGFVQAVKKLLQDSSLHAE